MISRLRGRVESTGSDFAIIEVNGIGFHVFMPTSTRSTLGAGEEVKLYTHLHLREDNVALYGFATADDLRLFEILLGVSGIGPRLALAMLSSMNAEQLVVAIGSGDAELLTGVPGIGKKLAGRVILELKDKIGTGWVTTPTAQLAANNTEVLAALTSLGYSIAEASRAIGVLPSSSKLSLEEKVKLALQYLGGR